jgi:hypothetical protein
MPKPSAPANQTVTQVQQLPPWVTAAAKDNLASATEISGNMAGPYTGPMVAGFNDDHNAAFDATRAAAGSGLPGIGTAQDTLSRVQGFNPSQVSANNVGAGSFLSGNLSGYMNPHIAEVENRALDTLDRSRQQSLNQTADQAMASKAFGGTRHGVMEGVTNAEAARAAGDLSAKLRSDGFNTAAGLMNADNDRALTADRSNQSAQLQAGVANQQAGLDAAKTQALAATQGVTAAQAGQQAGLQGAAALESIADKQRGLDQAYLGEHMAQYDALRGADLERLGIRMNALGMTPYGKIGSTTGPATTQGANPALGALGGAATGASLASTLGMAAGMYGMGGIGALLGLLSDRNDKTDIEKVGKDPDSGVPLYAYRYKGDPKSYPKVVGPMAQDVEKRFPGSVQKVDGKRVIKGGFLRGGM